MKSIKRLFYSFFLEPPKIKLLIFIQRTLEEGKYISDHLRCLLKCRERKSLTRMAKELIRITIRWKVIPFNYFRQALYDKNTPYSDRYVSFMPESKLLTFYMPVLSPVSYRMVIHNKYLFRQMLILNRVRVTNLILWSFSGVVYSDHGIIRNGEDLSIMLDAHKGKNLVLKPQNLSRGRGVRFLKIQEKEGFSCLVDSGGTVISFKNLLSESKKSQDWMMEEKIIQHESISRLYPFSINTVRIVTVTFPDNRVQFLCTLMRIGRSGSFIDSASAGGMHVHIDPVSGRLSGCAYLKTGNRVFRAHPDTGTIFEEVTVPFWNEILSTLKRLAKAFMFTHTIAFDVAVEKDGPIIIEGNPGWNPGTMERGSSPKGERILDAVLAWKLANENREESENTSPKKAIGEKSFGDIIPAYSEKKEKSA